MEETEYWRKAYQLSASEGADELTVSKYSGTDWCYVEMAVNGSSAANITIRSREMAQQLHFMLSQLLGKA